MAMALFSFLLEGCLIYGYFANTDLDISLWTLVERFVNASNKSHEDIQALIQALPDKIGNPVYDENPALFKTDLDFSSRWANDQTRVMESILNRFEGQRMALILLDLILATVGCAIGIASGSISKAWPVWLMVGVNCVATAIIFFSAGAHFAGSKMVFEFCDEIAYYLEDGNTDPIPMRLQYFVPSVRAPVFPYITNYFAVTAVEAVEQLIKKWKESNTWSIVKHVQPVSFNVSEPFYAEQVGATTNETVRGELQGLLENAAPFSRFLKAIDVNDQSTHTRSILRDEKFLTCSYLKDNMDMLAAAQVVGAVLLAIVTALGVPAIKQFAYAGKARLGGVLNGNRGGGGGGKAKAKRKA
jgi:hypothetical protein